jgi:hypothetical protein
MMNQIPQATAIPQQIPQATAIPQAAAIPQPMMAAPVPGFITPEMQAQIEAERKDIVKQKAIKIGKTVFIIALSAAAGILVYRWIDNRYCGCTSEQPVIPTVPVPDNTGYGDTTVAAFAATGSGMF